MSQAQKPPSSDDPRTLVEGAWRQIFATDADRHADRLAPGTPRFIDYAWAKFDPKTVLTILTSEEPAYAALKPILFSGLCTWVVCPTKPSLRQHGMLLVGIEHLRAAEAEGRKVFAGRDLPGHELLGDILGRVRVLGQDFFSDFYYPVGGLAQVLRSTTPGNFARSLERRSFEMMSVVALMQIYHHHVIHLSGTGKHHKASLNKGSALVRKIFGDLRGDKLAGVVSDNVNDRWQRLARTAALAYAASSIEIEPGRSFLDVIRAGEATFETHASLLNTWVGRAQYAITGIISQLYEPRFAEMNAEYLPLIEAMPIEAPVFNEEERMLIKEAFRK